VPTPVFIAFSRPLPADRATIAVLERCSGLWQVPLEGEPGCESISVTKRDGRPRRTELPHRPEADRSAG
jgi:hypothetical protein